MSGPELPALSYDEVIVQLEGADWLPVWRTLGRVLAARPGWRFHLVDGLPRWYHDGARLHACATSSAGRRVLAVFRQVDDDHALNWDYVGASALRSAVRCLEHGLDPYGEPLELGPAIDEALLRKLHDDRDRPGTESPIEGAA